MVSRNKVLAFFLLASTALFSSFSHAASDTASAANSAASMEEATAKLAQIAKPENDSQSNKLMKHAAIRYFKEKGFEYKKPTSNSNDKVRRFFSRTWKSITGSYKSEEHKFAQKLMEYSTHYYRSLRLIMFHKPLIKLHYIKVNEYYFKLQAALKKQNKGLPSYLTDAHEKWEKLHQADKESKGYIF